MSRLAIAVVLLLLAAFALPASQAQTGIRRCVSNDGQLIFTDRPCSDVQAVESAPTTSGDPAIGEAHVVAVRSCARKPEDLLFEVRSALEAQDANRLAGVYLWTGMGTREGYSLLDRLSAFSARPLVDVQLISSISQSDPPPLIAMPTGNSADPSTAGETTAPPADVTRGPDLIRIDQARSEKDPAAEISYFRIVPAAGCVWIQF